MFVGIQNTPYNGQSYTFFVSFMLSLTKTFPCLTFFNPARFGRMFGRICNRFGRICNPTVWSIGI